MRNSPFLPDEKEQISKHFGENILNKVLGDIETYSDKWKLRDLCFIPYYSVNCLFNAHSEQYGAVVLKIGSPSYEKNTEIQTLTEYGGRRFCRLYENDAANGVLLLERLLPGTRLREKPSLEKRLAVFCSVYDGLHIEAADETRYPTYLDWVSNITRYMSGRLDCREMFSYMETAQQLCESLYDCYPKKYLLHGDLHHDNILLDSDGQYRLIDPKGVVGDPIFDIARFILNEPYKEAPEPRRYLLRIIEEFSARLHIPAAILSQCFFIEATMSECWNIEDGAPRDEYEKQLKHVALIKTLLDGREN